MLMYIVHFTHTLFFSYTKFSKNGIHPAQSANGGYIWEWNYAAPSALLFHIADCYAITGSDGLAAKRISRSQVNRNA